MKTFGGGWTERKLDSLKQYVLAYEKVMKNQNFKLLYIDAFSGSGYRRTEKEAGHIRDFQKGSPLIVLENTQRFNKYIFIEKDRGIFQNLKQIERKFPLKNMIFKNEDANIYIKSLCKTTNWANHRAVLFMDPFAMEVEWDAMEAIAQTQAVDLWILFPAMAVNRLLYKDGKIPEKLCEKLDKTLGTTKWKEVFYQEKQQLSLFDKNSEIEKAASFEEIKRFYLERLNEAFPGAACNPLPLRNSKNSILFYLFFVVSNPRGKNIALRISQHILGRE